ncbi:MAG: hypothetical protein IJU50_08395, partial [Lachnospiraceae bacterium]|nr:hypothetical protein [Lachnospiraceae bacterium]
MPHVKEGRLLKGQGLLLCSDGFYRGLSEKEICQALGSLQRGKGSEAVDKRLAALAERALERGSVDHISAAFILNQDYPFL